MKTSSQLAKSITKQSNFRTYLIIKYFVDRKLVDDCYRAYAYFRWADDQVDDVLQTKSQRVEFIHRQENIITLSYKDKPVPHLSPEENLITDLIGSPYSHSPRLKSFIFNFLAIIKFDAHRKKIPISTKEFHWYTQTLATAVTDCILHFINHDFDYPPSPTQYHAARAACITHILRDYIQDVDNEYYNLPQEVQDKHRIVPKDIDHPAFIFWVKQQVKQANLLFSSGKQYLNQLPFRTQAAACLYCFRFRYILNTIQHQKYLLKSSYKQQGLTIHLLMFFKYYLSNNNAKFLSQL